MIKGRFMGVWGRTRHAKRVYSICIAICRCKIITQASKDQQRGQKPPGKPRLKGHKYVCYEPQESHLSTPAGQRRGLGVPGTERVHVLDFTPAGQRSGFGVPGTERRRKESPCPFAPSGCQPRALLQVCAWSHTPSSWRDGTPPPLPSPRPILSSLPTLLTQNRQSVLETSASCLGLLLKSLGASCLGHVLKYLHPPPPAHQTYCPLVTMIEVEGGGGGGVGGGKGLSLCRGGCPVCKT